MSRTSVESHTPYDPDASIAARKTALRRGSYPIAVYGLGKIGLPVAVAFADLSGTVTGVDVDDSVVEAVNHGRNPLDHEPGIDAPLETAAEDGSCVATTDAEAAADEASIHVVVVPVALDESNEADLREMRTTVDAIATGLDPGDLVVVESTVPPGTATEVVKPRLVARSGLDAEAFGVASCPERVSSGRALRDVRGAYPRVVGGVTPAGTDAAFAVYDELVGNDIFRADARTAEAVKLLEGVYRDVNIALANELALAFDGSGIDVREAIRIANTQPYSDIHTPGAGVGGHCIPWYPHFLRNATNTDMPLVSTGRAVNESMPHHLADRLREEFDIRDWEAASARVCVLGLAYRPGLPETAASPTFDLVERLEESFGDVAVVDPHVDRGDTSLELLSLAEVRTYDPDAIVLMTAHAAFEDLSPEVLDEAIVIDGRDALDTDATYVVGSDP